MKNQIVGLISLTVGAVSAFFLAWALIRHNLIRKWHSQPGTILESRIIPGIDSFEPYVKYQFEVLGQSYSSDTHKTITRVYEQEREAEKRLEPFPVGKTVNVYFDPQNPKDSLIETRSRIWAYVFWAFFSLFFLFTGGGLILQS